MARLHNAHGTSHANSFVSKSSIQSLHTEIPSTPSPQLQKPKPLPSDTKLCTVNSTPHVGLRAWWYLVQRAAGASWHLHARRSPSQSCLFWPKPPKCQRVYRCTCVYIYISHMGSQATQICTNMTTWTLCKRH